MFPTTPGTAPLSIARWGRVTVGILFVLASPLPALRVSVGGGAFPEGDHAVDKGTVFCRARTACKAFGKGLPGRACKKLRGSCGAITLSHMLKGRCQFCQ